MGLPVHRILLIGSENENGDTTNDKLDELSIASEIGLELEPLQMDFDKLTGHGDESSSRKSSSEAGTCFRYSEISESRKRERESAVELEFVQYTGLKCDLSEEAGPEDF